LNAKIFDAGISPTSITTQCACASREFNGKRLFVVGTPEFLEPTGFTAQESEVVDYLSNIFGPQAINYTIIIFIRGDELARNQSTIEQYFGRLRVNTPLKKVSRSMWKPLFIRK
jgi:hypothetical protein